jgi:hypothetical protein
MQDFVLMVLCFNLPSVISALSMIIDKFSVRLDDISPRVLDILRGINQNYTSTKEIQFDQEADSIYRASYSGLATLLLIDIGGK